MNREDGDGDLVGFPIGNVIIITVSRTDVPISKAWEDGRLLISTPSLITDGNIVGKKQKHG